MTESRSRSRTAQHSVLRNPLTVVTTALASFLAVLVLLTARVVSGHDPALRTSASSTVFVSHGAHTSVRTTASGRVLGPASGGAGVQAGATQPVALVTRTSGGLAGGGERDA